ncbi:MAG: hypothetical protein RMM17_11285 [Acidobacteriota bacterium]|nr:hypothetical protein [Blastocatellia bacterium]MDW8413254.1 hypothetical protein [Acidobacteriota bacterium]
MLLICLICLFSCKRVDDGPLTEELFRFTLEKQFATAKSKMDTVKIEEIFTPIDHSNVIFEQKSQGNAAELYWEVFKDKLDSRSESRQQLLETVEPIMQFVDLSIKENLEISPQKAESIKADLQKAARLPELEKIEQAAQLRYFRLTGEVVPISAKLTVNLIPMTLLRAYSVALMAKALERENSRDISSAERLLQTIVAMGGHFAADPKYENYFNGQVLMEFGCYLLKSFYNRNKQASKIEAVEKLAESIKNQAQKAGSLAFRDETGQPVNPIKALGYFDEGIDSLLRIALDERLPLAIRSAAVEHLFYGYVFRYMVVQHSGRNPDTSKYAPPSEQRIAALDKLKSIPDKTLSQMAVNASTVLTNMKQMQSSGERARYWMGLN